MPSPSVSAAPQKRRGGIFLPSLRSLREACVKDGGRVTRAKMAKDLDLDYSFLWRIEKGESRAGAETSLAISDYLGVSIDALRKPEEIGA